MSSSDYFFCERFHCRMRREVCVARQGERMRTIASGKLLKTMRFAACQGCEQGMKMKLETGNLKLEKT